MSTDQRAVLYERYRRMDTERLLELRGRELTEVASAVLDEVIAERSPALIKYAETPTHTPSVSGETDNLYGVRGWLAFLVLGMTVLGPLLGALKLAVDFSAAEYFSPSLTALPIWNTYKESTWVAFLVVVCFSVYGGWGLARGRDWSVVNRATLMLWLTGPVASIVMSMAIPIAVFGTTRGIAAESIGAVLASFVIALVWTAYLSKSARVRNTYDASTCSED